MKKKFLFMRLMLLCAVAQGAWAEDVTFNYRSWNETTASVETSQVTKQGYQVLEGNHEDDWVGLGGNYVVRGKVSFKVLNITGERALLVLEDGCELNCKHIKLEPGHSLHIFSQSDGDSQGKLLVRNYDEDYDPVYKYAAAIGGGEDADMGSLYIHGGYISARTHTSGDTGGKKSYGAGIGGGNDHGIAGELVIYGGKVTAHGNEYAAGIGGGDCGNQGGQVIIYGGEVNADSERYGAGIGGGDGNQERGNGGVVKIYGGTVNANGGYDKNVGRAGVGAAGIGGGRNGRAGSVYIYGGTVAAIGGKDAAGIGGSRNYGGGLCEISGGTVFAKGGPDTSFNSDYSAPAIGGGRLDGPGSAVSITGGKVMLAKLGKGSDACSVIGGGSTSGDNGTLTIGAGMKVSWNDDAWSDKGYVYYLTDVNSSMQLPALTMVDGAGAREEACRSNDHLFVVIDSCKHEEATYTYTINFDDPEDARYSLTHTKYCNRCNGIADEKEPHQGDDCVCGKRSMYTFTFYVPTTVKDTYQKSLTARIGAKSTFCLPESSIVPEGYVFKGWEQNPAPEDENRWAAIRGGDESSDINIPAGTWMQPQTGQDDAKFFARFLYVFESHWDWAASGATATLTLSHPDISNNIILTSTGDNAPVTITSEEIKDDAGNFVGTRYMAKATYTVNGYDYDFTDILEAVSIFNPAIELSNADTNDGVVSDSRFQTVDITLKDYTLWKDGSWNTLCLPFGLKLENSPSLEGATVMQLESSGFSDGTLTLNFSEVTSIDGGKPYLIRWEKSSSYVAYNGTNAEECSDLVSPTFRGIYISAPHPTRFTTQYVDMKGSYLPMKLTAGNRTVLYMGSGNTLYYPAADQTAGYCHAFLYLNGLTAGDLETNSVKAFKLNFGDDETTGIISLTGETGSEGAVNGWYSIDGRQLNGQPAQPGIYIHNGKKLMLK